MSLGWWRNCKEKTEPAARHAKGMRSSLQIINGKAAVRHLLNHISLLLEGSLPEYLGCFVNGENWSMVTTHPDDKMTVNWCIQICFTHGEAKLTHLFQPLTEIK